MIFSAANTADNTPAPMEVDDTKTPEPAKEEKKSVSFMERSFRSDEIFFFHTWKYLLCSCQ